MIKINYCYSTDTIIHYWAPTLDRELTETYSGKLEEIAEHCCDVVVAHNFTNATVISNDTGEILIQIERPY